VCGGHGPVVLVGEPGSVFFLDAGSLSQGSDTYI
jgi:hypothetical protein